MKEIILENKRIEKKHANKNVSTLEYIKLNYHFFNIITRKKHKMTKIKITKTQQYNKLQIQKLNNK